MAEKRGLHKYRVSVHKSGGYRYASTQPTRYNPETKKKECRHVHWGTLTEDNKFYPNRNFLLATAEERDALIFPEDWDLSELDRLPLDAAKVEQKYDRLLSSLGKKRSEAVGDDNDGGEKISSRGVLQLIEMLESEGLSSDRIIEIIKYVEA